MTRAAIGIDTVTVCTRLWAALTPTSTAKELRVAASAWKRYQWVVGLEATLAGEALRHLDEIRRSPEYARYEAARATYRASAARSRAKQWYAEQGKANRSTPEVRDALNASRRARWASLTTEQREKLNANRRECRRNRRG